MVTRGVFVVDNSAVVGRKNSIRAVMLLSDTRGVGRRESVFPVVVYLAIDVALEMHGRAFAGPSSGEDAIDAVVRVVKNRTLQVSATKYQAVIQAFTADAAL